MEIKLSEVNIPETTPFANCKLGREKYGIALTSIVKSYANGFVLAINNEWGTGKTTFLRMWIQHLKNNNLKTVYFNAWENDFDVDPLVAFIAELKTLTNYKENETYKSLLKKGASLAQNVVPSLIKAIVEKYLGAGVVPDLMENISKSGTYMLKDEIESYSLKKKNLIEFRKVLEDFIADNSTEKPIVFVIDELDRCRPSYAVELLEKVKHFFSVKGIVFVLSIDKIQLQNAIKGYYGSDRINATEYLRRFIDLEYVLPAPSTKDFCNYLFSYFNFDIFLNHEYRMQHKELQNDSNALIDFSSLLFEKAKSSLRQQEKLYAHTRIVLRSYGVEYYIFPELTFFLIFLRDSNFEIYEKISKRNYSMQELIDKIESVFPVMTNETDKRSFIYIEALLNLFYFNHLREIDFNLKLFNTPGPVNLEIPTVVCGIDKDQQTFKSFLQSFRNKRFENQSIKYLLFKIDLLENLSG